MVTSPAFNYTLRDSRLCGFVSVFITNSFLKMADNQSVGARWFQRIFASEPLVASWTCVDGFNRTGIRLWMTQSTFKALWKLSSSQNHGTHLVSPCLNDLHCNCFNFLSGVSRLAINENLQWKIIKIRLLQCNRKSVTWSGKLDKRPTASTTHTTFSTKAKTQTEVKRSSGSGERDPSRCLSLCYTMFVHNTAQRVENETSKKNWAKLKSFGVSQAGRE